MLNKNRLSAEITPEAMTAILDHVKGIETQLGGFAVSLSTKEKRTMNGVGVKTQEFMDKVLEYAEKNPDLVPSYIDLAELRRDIELTRNLWALQKHILPILGRVNDTMAVSGDDAYAVSRLFYHHIKTVANANLPGAATIAKELGELFRRPRSKSTGEAGDEQQVNETNESTNS